MPTAIVSLGSNLGDRTATLDSAAAALDATPGVRVVRRSSWYETSPIGGPGFQEPFLNGAAALETSLEPEALLTELQRIENEHGRIREEHWGPRTLDVDLLTYDDVVMHTPRLTLPHPRMSYRKFVLQGVVEVAPELKHPLLDRTFSELHRHLDGAANYVAFASGSASISIDFRSQFAAEAADCGTARLVDATPDDVPAFAELIASRQTQMEKSLRFLSARVAAIRESLAEADSKWLVDDGWILAEEQELAQRNEVEKWKLYDATLVTRRFVELGIIPKLLVVLRAKHESPREAISGLKQLLPEIPLPPIIDLDISDRERALTEFAAALDAAR